MSSEYVSDIISVSHGGSKTHTTPENINIVKAEYRWRGISSWSTMNTSTWNIDNKTASGIGDQFVYLSTTIPHLPGSNENESAWGWDVWIAVRHITASIPLWFSAYITDSLGSNEHQELRGDLNNFTKGGNDYLDYDAGNYSGSQVIASVGIEGTETYPQEGEVSFSATLYARLQYSYQIQTKTQNPTLSVNGVNNAYSGSIEDSVWTDWKSMSGLTEGSNSLNYSISGSGQADLQFKYEHEPSLMPLGYISLPSGLEVPYFDPNDIQSPVRLGDANNNIVTLGLVDVSDDKASPIRIATSNGVKSIRKEV